jgi:peptidoglycan/LPS O-acetylase OafA/YrhL
MTASKAPREYFPALDGLRGIAIILVLIAHNFYFIWGAKFVGAYGVDLFFALSGFLITNILLQLRWQPHSLKSFYKRRILRIFPVYYLVLVIFFVCAPFSNNSVIAGNYEYNADNWLWVSFHLNNFLGWFRPELPRLHFFPHFWSLSLEEQFYLFWPFIILYIKSEKTLLKVILSLFALATASRLIIWASVANSNFFFYYTDNIRLDCLFAGSILAVLRLVNPLKYVKHIKIIGVVFN